MHTNEKGLMQTMVDGSFGEEAMQPAWRNNTVIAREGGHLWALSRDSFESVSGRGVAPPPPGPREGGSAPGGTPEGPPNGKWR